MPKRTPQNSGPKKKVPVGRRFKKGQSGNPGGRPKGLGQFIREHSGDGKELAEYAFKVLRGKSLGKIKRMVYGVEIEEEIYPDAFDRQQALNWLGDRGWGKPVQSIEANGTGVTGILILPAEDPNA